MFGFILMYLLVTFILTEWLCFTIYLYYVYLYTYVSLSGRLVNNHNYLIRKIEKNLYFYHPWTRILQFQSQINLQLSLQTYKLTLMLIDIIHQAIASDWSFYRSGNQTVTSSVTDVIDDCNLWEPPMGLLPVTCKIYVKR